MTMLQLNACTVLAFRDEANLDFGLECWVGLPVGADVPREHQARGRLPQEYDAPVTRASVITALVPAAPDPRLDHCVRCVGLADLVVGQRPPTTHLLGEHSPCHRLGRLNAHDFPHAIGIGTGGRRLPSRHDSSYDVLLPCLREVLFSCWTLAQHEIFKPRALVLREVWVCLYFIDLLGVPLAVRRNKQNKFIAIHLAHRAVHHMIAQLRCVLQKLLCHRAALHKMPDRAIRRTETIAGYQWFWCLGFVGAVWNHSHDRFVDVLHIAPELSRRRDHHFFLDQVVADKVLRRSDVLHYLRYGPAVWRRLEVPLSLRKTLRCLQNTPFCGF